MTEERSRDPHGAAPERAGLVVDRIGKSYRRRPVVRSVSLTLQRGEVVGLLGPNGAGKTTCFYMITGLIPVDYGTIHLDGRDVTTLPMHRRARLGVGYLPQEASIFRGLSVEDNIRAVLELVERTRSKRERKLDTLLAEFSITHLRRTPALALSGGERRRVEIARALATAPDFILLDEPFAGVDPIAVSDIRGLVSHLKERGIGVLITDHNVRETLSIIDRAYILHDGHVLKEGTPQDIIGDAAVRRVYLGEGFRLQSVVRRSLHGEPDAMSMGINLQLRQSQSLVMTPQLQQAIKLLQMSNLDLAEYVAQELEKNPFLEIAPPTPEERRSASDSPAEGAPEPASSRNDLSTELQRENLGRAEETFDTGLDNVYADESRADRQADAAAGQSSDESAAWASVGKGSNSRFESSEFDLESSLVAEKSLRDHLLDQLGITIAEPRIRAIAAYLIEYIDEAGYLKIEDEVIADLLGASVEDVSKAVDVLQRFDPAGVAARGLADCLRLQLRDRNRLDPAMETMLANLDMLAEGKLQKLMKLCGVETDDMREMIEEIRALDPKPGTRFHSEIAQTLIPDAFVRKNAFGGWSVELNAETLPKVLVNTRYASEVAKGGSTVKDYLTENLQSANWLAKSLDQRARTILKVSTEIVRQQDGFLEYGISELRPLNLKTVADAIGMHESTVSRVTSNKYLSTTRGVFELKFFFTAAISSVDGGEAYSAESVRHKLKTMIDAEDRKAILSDDKLVKMLRAEGIDIARRTVAKYRESMDIPSSVQRRRQKNQTL